jgi:hypothetical protein
MNKDLYKIIMSICITSIVLLLVFYKTLKHEKQEFNLLKYDYEKTAKKLEDTTTTLDIMYCDRLYHSEGLGYMSYDILYSPSKTVVGFEELKIFTWYKNTTSYYWKRCFNTNDNKEFKKVFVNSNELGCFLVILNYNDIPTTAYKISSNTFNRNLESIK